MPTVPVLNTGVRDAALPNVQGAGGAPIESFGGGDSLKQVGNALSRINDTVADFGLEISKEAKKNADKMQLLEYESALAKQKDFLEYDPNSGYRSKKKKDAIESYDGVMSDWESHLKETSKMLHNDSQRMAAKAIENRYTLDLNRSVNIHFSNERLQYDNDLTKSFVDNEQRAAAKAAVAGDMDRVQSSIANQVRELEEYGKRNGMHDAEGRPDAITQQSVMEAISKTHENVINEYVGANQDKAAMQYYEAVKSGLDPEAAKRVKNSIRSSYVRGEAQRQADQLIAKHGSASAAVKEAAKIEDPEVREKTEQRVKEHFTLKDQAVKADYEQNMKLASDIVSAGKEVPPNLMAKLSLADQKNVSEYRQYRIEGKNVATIDEVKYNLIKMSSSQNRDDREEFKSMNLYQYRNKLNNHDFDNLIEIQRKMRTGEIKVEQELERLSANNTIVDRVLEQYGYNPNPKPKTAESAFDAKFRSEVDRIALKRQRDTQKPISDEERQSIANSLMIDVVTKKRFLIPDVKKKVIDLAPGESGDVTFEAIPIVEKQAIANELIGKGLPVNNKTILDAYLKKLNELGVYGK